MPVSNQMNKYRDDQESNHDRVHINIVRQRIEAVVDHWTPHYGNQTRQFVCDLLVGNDNRHPIGSIAEEEFIDEVVGSTYKPEPVVHSEKKGWNKKVELNPDPPAVDPEEEHFIKKYLEPEFEAGNYVTYIPPHAKDQYDPECECGIVKSVREDGTVFVRYHQGDTAANTKPDQLVMGWLSTAINRLEE